ncbi:MAG: hypothetical protein ABI855_12175 [Bacteroidota bacterium]
MQAITFNYLNSKIHFNEESLCLRYCFIVSELAISAGKSYETLAFEHYYTPKNMVEKAEMIAAYYQNKNDKEWDIKADEVRMMLQMMKKMKYHSKEGIVMQKKFERSLDQLFTDIKKELYDSLCSTGLPQLYPLAKEGLLRICPLKHDDPEFENDEFIPASKIMQLQLPPDEVNDPEIFCMGNLFFFPDFFKPLNIPLQFTDKKAAAGNGFLHPCLLIPNINLLSAQELETVNNQVKEPAGRFNEKMNEWILMTRKNLPVAETHAFFKDYILPASDVLGTILGENEILNHCSRLQNDEVASGIYLGELPYSTVLNYYKYFEAINETTFNKVMEAKEHNPLVQGRMPVMILCSRIEGSYAIPADPVPDESQKVLPSKKSLSID